MMRVLAHTDFVVAFPHIAEFEGKTELSFTQSFRNTL